MTEPKSKSRSILYNEDFYASLDPGSLASARRVLPVVQELVHPSSVLDVGCGTGQWLRAWAELGVSDSIGVDGNYIHPTSLNIDLDRYVPIDLSSGSFALQRTFDLVMCLEVAEHLAPAVASTFIASLTSHSSVVLFSAATPNQGGRGHVNEQWPEYWVSRFNAMDYSLVDVVRPRIWTDSSVDFWYRQNTLLFVRSGLLESFPDFWVQSSSFAGLPVVHPDLFRGAIQEAGVRQLLSEIPTAMMRLLSGRYGRSRAYR